jgi:hypothetical protein
MEEERVSIEQGRQLLFDSLDRMGMFSSDGDRAEVKKQITELTETELAVLLELAVETELMVALADQLKIVLIPARINLN